MSILFFLLFGLVVGFLARAIMPGRQHMSIVATILVGVVGSFLGGFIGNALSGRPLLELHSTGFIGSILGALAVLLVVGFIGRRRAPGAAV
jgi:uncharacterized membrane protein YeaQ/YmgE (transglycosylase-associated protein family)